MSPKKTLVLGTLLLVPVLAFLFLKLFGVNRFGLPTYYPMAVDSTQVQGKWQYDTTYHQIPGFNLTSQTGQPFSQNQLEGNLYVANFFYTDCQSNCRQVSTQLSRVQDAFRLQPSVKILSFSLKPEQDSVQVLKAYANSFRANPEKWIFLTGPSAQMQQLLESGFKASEAATLSLEQRLLLIDGNKQVRGIYNGSDAAEVDRLITEINVLLAEDKTGNGKQTHQ